MLRFSGTSRCFRAAAKWFGQVGRWACLGSLKAFLRDRQKRWRVKGDVTSRGPRVEWGGAACAKTMRSAQGRLLIHLSPLPLSAPVPCYLLLSRHICWFQSPAHPQLRLSAIASALPLLHSSLLYPSLHSLPWLPSPLFVKLSDSLFPSPTSWASLSPSALCFANPKMHLDGAVSHRAALVRAHVSSPSWQFELAQLMYNMHTIRLPTVWYDSVPFRTTLVQTIDWEVVGSYRKLEQWNLVFGSIEPMESKTGTMKPIASTVWHSVFRVGLGWLDQLDLRLVIFSQTLTLVQH